MALRFGASKAEMILGDGFCIDAREVTNARYAAFLATGPAISSQTPECALNLEFGSAPPSDEL